MSTTNLSLTVSLAAIAGAALGSNPGFQPELLGLKLRQAHYPVHEAAFAQAYPTPDGSGAVQPPPPGRFGAESSQLRALRLAEDELFPGMGGSSLPLGPQSVAVPQAASCDLPEQQQDNISSRFNVPKGDDFLRGLNMPDLPVRGHERVAKYIRFFAGTDNGRKIFTTWLRRSGKYRGIIAREFGRRDLPKDLEAVAFIESGFWPTAVSHAGATGMWQFMPKTARAYGLTVAPQYDERRSIWRSTEAAAEHLKDLYGHLRSWDLALAAYNLGHERLKARMREMGTDDFWTLSEIEGALPRETALYVPKILAVSVIINNLDDFGFSDVDIAPPLQAAPIEVPPGIQLSLLARAAGTSVRYLKDLNPELGTEVTPDLGGPVRIHIPNSGMARARVMLPKLLGDEADRLDLEVSDDFDWGRDELNNNGRNRLENAANDIANDAFGIGQIRRKHAKKAPERNRVSYFSDEFQTQNQNTKLSFGPKPYPVTTTQREVLYRVSRGDTVSGLARRFEVPQTDLVTKNQLRNPSLVMTGQFLELSIPVERATREHNLYYRVREGDTVMDIADTFGMSVDEFTQRARIRDPDAVKVGQLLRLYSTES